MKHRIFTVWAGDEDTCWMIAAHDEFSWADPDRCEAEVAEAKQRTGSGWQFREVVFEIDLDAVSERFRPGGVFAAEIVAGDES